ncbi:ABC cobalamin uptake system ATPase BtuD [Thalassotalea insulae]|uniref:ABC cobalamin uptake system ATPase BtuD n=1 Tax=Thalassotalea insulae TaxID=2056778 RepID=A0ABQ6GVL5_9GAMM|nr:ABC transporter ATP-binding protein [Thalassotalea insulae]GLX79239.1 ABC cobalamin uptake system ATPase BtuD [Thalassotalea insulae]
MTAVQIQAQNINWQIDGKTIVEDVSFTVAKNETFGIVGPNGAGKTSLLKCLYQEYPLSSGQVLLDGMPLDLFDRREVAQKIAVVSQLHEAVFNLTVLDIVNMGLIPYKTLFARNTDQDRQLIAQALTTVDLLDKQHQVFNTLSGGEQQRCLIARAIVQRPQVLIMDEPTNHLDVFYQHQILSMVKKLGLTLIMTIHDLNLAAQYCDRLLLLSGGQVLACDTPDIVLQASRLKEVFHLDCLVDRNPLTEKVRVTYAMIDEEANHE